MLHFFRKIRRDLIANSKFNKYIKYAIGEIVLVVIGILIALQINIWNENRKEIEKFDRRLIEVRKELCTNILEFNKVLIECQEKDSILFLLRNRLLTLEILNKNRNILYTLQNAPQFTIQDEEFKNISLIDLEFNDTQDSIIRLLKEIYIIDKTHNDIYDDRISDIARSNIMDLSSSKSWYFNLSEWDGSSGQISDYYLKDSLFTNKADVYSIYLMKMLVSLVIQIRYKSIAAHRMISRYFNEKDTLLNYDINQYQSYIGLYQYKNDTVKIENINGKLFSIMIRKDGALSPKELLPVSKTYFTSGLNKGFLYFVISEDQKVDKFVFNNDYRNKLSFKKIQ